VRYTHSPASDATIGDKHADSIETTERNGRKTLTTVQGLPKKFDQKKILKVIKKKFGMFGVPHGAAQLLFTHILILGPQLAMAPSSSTLRWER
jgi:hypothetical protein